MKTIEEKRTVSKWFTEMANWYVLFVQTYEEQRVADRLQNKFDAEKHVAFVPTKDYAFKKQGKTKMHKVPWLSGYVFIASTTTTEEFRKMVEPLIYNDSTIFKLLSNDNSKQSIKLLSNDRNLMMNILDENFNIPAIMAEIIDGKIRVDEDSVEKIGGRIKKLANINKRH